MCLAGNVLDQFLPNSLDSSFMIGTINLSIDNWCYSELNWKQAITDLFPDDLPSDPKTLMRIRLWNRTKTSLPFSVCQICKSRWSLIWWSMLGTNLYWFMIASELQAFDPFCRSGAERLKHLFKVNRGSARSRLEGVFTTGTDSPFLIVLTGFLRPHLFNYFKEFEGLAEAQAKVKWATKQNCSAIVDGRHFHAAFLDLASEDEAGHPVQCPVTFQLQGTNAIH